jgi:hypothetical protein
MGATTIRRETLRRDDENTMKAAAQEYLRRYPAGFRHAEVAKRLPSSE